MVPLIIGEWNISTSNLFPYEHLSTPFLYFSIETSTKIGCKRKNRRLFKCVHSWNVQNFIFWYYTKIWSGKINVHLSGGEYGWSFLKGVKLLISRWIVWSEDTLSSNNNVMKECTFSSICFKYIYQYQMISIHNNVADLF